MSGWWASHNYSRRSVEDVKAFCGWSFLLQLVEKAKGNLRDQALIATAFETGGRIREVLALKTSHFIFKKKFIVVNAMPVYKRYEKIGDYINTEGKKHWKTEAKEAYRTFPIPLHEPLVPYIVDWVKQRENNLFKIGRIRAYQIITSLDKNIFPHWFRAQRASQLAVEYGYSIHDLVDFFNWLDLQTAIHYSRMGWQGLADKMTKK